MQRAFIVGCPRSGTTLVQAMLARHPDVFSLQETRIFEALLGGVPARWGDRGARAGRRWYHRAGLAQAWGRARLRELEQAYGTGRPRRPEPVRWTACVRRYVALLDHAAEAAGKSHWVEKTPNHLLFLDEINARIPDARFVHVLRDGADVIASLTDADLHQQTTAFAGGVAQWTRRWNHAMQLHRAHMDDPRHLLLCLEDLVADPAGEWERLRRFLQLEEAVPLPASAGSAVADAQAEPWKRDAIAGIVDRPARKRQALLGPATLEWLDQHLDDYEAIKAALHDDHSASVQVQAGAPQRAGGAARC